MYPFYLEDEILDEFDTAIPERTKILKDLAIMRFRDYIKKVDKNLKAKTIIYMDYSNNA